MLQKGDYIKHSKRCASQLEKISRLNQLKSIKTQTHETHVQQRRRKI